MKTTLKEKSHLSVEKTNNSESNSNNEELIKRHEIPNSPFVVITTDEGSFGTLGKYRITEIHQNKHDAIEDTQKMTWNRIIQIISLINQILKDN